MNMIEQIKADRSSDTRQSRDRREMRITDMEAALIAIQEHIEWDCDGLGAFIPAEALGPFITAIGDTK